MPFLLVVERMIRLGALALVDLRRWPVVVPLWCVWLAHLMVYVVASDPTHPLWGGWVAPLIRSAFGEKYLHYPQSFIGLPVAAAGLRLPIDAVVYSILAIWTMVATVALHDGQRPRFSEFGAALKRHGMVALFVTAISTVTWTVLYVLPIGRWLGRLRLDPESAQLLTIGWGLVPASLLAVLLFALPSRYLDGGGPWVSIKQSFGHVRREMLLSIGLSCFPYVAGLPFFLVLLRSARVANALRPEVVLGIMLAQSFVSIVVAFAVANAATRIWIGRSEKRS